MTRKKTPLEALKQCPFFTKFLSQNNLLSEPYYRQKSDVTMLFYALFSGRSLTIPFPKPKILQSFVILLK